MAQLFGKGTIKDHIIALDGFSQEKIEIVKRLYQDFQAGNLNDESRYEQTFNQLFFGELLGYEDRINRIPKGGVVGSGIADLTLGIFKDGSYTPEDVQIVCELKGAKSNLSKKQFGHGGLSPVGQGFAYKTGLKNCKWLVVSNFYEIRLYRDNQTDFEVWTLDELIDAKDDYFNLRKIYLLLHKNNLISGVGSSKTESLLSHFREEQQSITKEFYKKYKELRLDLINDLKQRNQSTSIELLIEKAQKIIDRLIFIFFCEDKGLLPDKKLKENIMRSQEAGFTPWEITKKFFHLVDKGSESLGVPHGYNGGLFKEDPDLNALEVGDAICKKFIDLTNYDFDDELSVNVLGHIFEQSISDLENLKINLLGQEVETEQLADTGKGRRKKDGIFYTPEYIVDYIVQNSVMKYLNEKEDECIQKYQSKKDKRQAELLAYQEYQQILQNIKVLDPACGSGAFLVRVFDVLFEENKRVGKILNSLFDDEFLYKNILTNNIYGVDLNAESVEITKLSLWLKSAQKDKKLNNLDANIKCGNSLIDDPAVAGNKAFDWNVEFKEIMKNGGFDVIVGNPPYGARFSEEEKIVFRKKFKEVEFKIDSYVLFLFQVFGLLKTNGFNYFIIPNTLLDNFFMSKIRKKLLMETEIKEIIDLDDKVFNDAIVHSMIFGFKNIKKESYDILSKSTNNLFGDGKLIPNKYFQKQENYGFLIRNYSNQGLLEKLNKKALHLENILDIRQSIKTGNDVIYLSSEKKGDNYKKVIGGKHIKKWLLINSDLYIDYGKHLACPRDYKIFEQEKILIREAGNIITATYDNENYYVLSSLYNCILKDSKFNLKYLLSLINSKLFQFQLQLLCFDKTAGAFTKARIYHYYKLPIKEIPLSDQQPYIEKADKMLSLNKELHELTDKFLHRIQDNLKVEKITKKLETFYQGEFRDFLDELKKQKISLSLSDQDTREPYFKEYKEKILALKNEIDKTDKEIDEMVFDLYGLSEEERKVVLGG